MIATNKKNKLGITVGKDLRTVASGVRAREGDGEVKAERWKQVNDLFQSATERAPDERAAFLDEACQGDERLRREVGSLLTSYDRAENFIELPAFQVTPELLTDDRSATSAGELIGPYRMHSLIG